MQTHGTNCVCVYTHINMYSMERIVCVYIYTHINMYSMEQIVCIYIHNTYIYIYIYIYVAWNKLCVYMLV